jgi:cell division protein FtsI (penicillin-binding protein 3)/stage V sporulation protein D (sporulation-specific penicillin-binding protein)
MYGRTDSKGRLFLLLVVVIAMSGGLAMRLAYWQISQRQELVTAAGDGATVVQNIPSERGTIYDRTGMIVLAQTINRYRVIAAPHDLAMSDRKHVADALVDYLGLTGDPERALRAVMDGKSYYVILADNVDAGLAKEIADDGLPGITLQPQPIRVYPQAGGAPHTSLAAQLLGFVNAAGQGQYGVEQAYNSILAGRAQVTQIDTNLSGTSGIKVLDAGVPGEDIRTTIDAGLQFQVEQEVYAAWVADKAKTVSVVVMDPKTGEILAEASYPSYDANAYQAVAAQDPSLFMDPAISEVYEPGSVFKMFTASAALQTQTTLLTTKINDYGVLSLPDGTEVADANKTAMGWMQFQDIIAWSRNVGATQVAFRLGKGIPAASKVLYGTWQKYGIGQKTGVDLAGEVPGLVNDPAKQAWRPIELANASFGQGVAVTPLQILRAYTAMANGGTLLTPHAVQPLSGPTSSPSGHQIIDGTLSQSLTGLMGHVISAGPSSYGKGTLIPGYLVGGKTGTAQIWDPTLDDGKGGWMPETYNYSFYGYVGRTAPEVMISSVIHEGTPTLVRQGVLPLPEESYQLFRRVATDAVASLGIPPRSSSASGTASPSGPTRSPSQSAGSSAAPLG